MRGKNVENSVERDYSLVCGGTRTNSRNARGKFRGDKKTRAARLYRTREYGQVKGIRVEGREDLRFSSQPVGPIFFIHKDDVERSRLEGKYQK